MALGHMCESPWDISCEGRAWLGWKVSTLAKLLRVADPEWEKTYWNRSPCWSDALALTHRLMEKGPIPAAQACIHSHIALQALISP